MQNLSSFSFSDNAILTESIATDSSLSVKVEDSSESLGSNLFSKEESRIQIPNLDTQRNFFSQEFEHNDRNFNRLDGETQDDLSLEEKELLKILERQNSLIETKFNENLRKNSGSNSAGFTVQVTEGELENDWEFWGKVLNDFDNLLKRSSKQLCKKIHLGVPKGIRGLLWAQMAKHHPSSFALSFGKGFDSGSADFQGDSVEFCSSKISLPSVQSGQYDLEDVYVELLKLSSPYEKMIVRDLARTFPKHDFFKGADGKGQQCLFNVMKAYSLFDPEVGYCQGLSFIVGTLLLNMPEEMAFACLVHLMLTYKLRGLFTPKMELLQLRLYQFDRLLQEILPRIYCHLEEQGIRSTMYASQWILTLFSYRLPLQLVFRLLDIIFAAGVVPGVAGSEGGMLSLTMERVSDGVAAVSAVASGTNILKHNDTSLDTAIVIFRFAFALLKKNEDMVLALDFEPLLEFLKNGLFDIYGGFEDEVSAESEPVARTDGSLNTSYRRLSVLHRRHQTVKSSAVNDFVKDAMATQFRNISRKRLVMLKKDYEDLLKQDESKVESSLEAQNHRLVVDLRRTERLMHDLNKEHCELAAQLVGVRLTLVKERETCDLLREKLKNFENSLLDNGSSRTEKDLLLGQIVELKKQNALLQEELARWKSLVESKKE